MRVERSTPELLLVLWWNTSLATLCFSIHNPVFCYPDQICRSSELMELRFQHHGQCYLKSSSYYLSIVKTQAIMALWLAGQWFRGVWQWVWFWNYCETAQPLVATMSQAHLERTQNESTGLNYHDIREVKLHQPPWLLHKYHHSIQTSIETVFSLRIHS